MSDAKLIALPVPQGLTWAQLPEAEHLAVPAEVLTALDRARGALVRTVYAVTDGAGAVFALGMHRPHTAQEKLTALSGDASLFETLLRAASERAEREGALLVKVELAAHDTAGSEAAGKGTAGREAAARETAARETAVSAGFVALRPPVEPGPVSSAAPVGYVHRRGGRSRRELGYYRQTTEITCGPVALLGALESLGLVPEPTRLDELRLWRAATLSPDTDAHGLALLADASGAEVAVVTNQPGALVLDPNLTGWEAQLRGDLQADFVARAGEAGINSEVREFTIAEVRRAVEGGAIVVLLVDELAMHGVACAHWVTVHGAVDGALVVDDPWTDAEFGETWVDAHELPIRDADLEAMAVWGGYRAMLVLSASPPVR